MPHSGIAFVGCAFGAHDAHMFFTIFFNKGIAVMSIDKLLRSAGFALASFAVVAGVGYTIEYLPVVNVLAR